jgi:AraC-like DNA-binding protein
MQLNQSAASPCHSLIEGMAVLRTTLQPSQRTLVAESRLSIGIRIAGSAQVLRGTSWDDLPRFTLTGLHCGSRTVRTLPDSCLVLAHLHPAAALALGVEARQILALTRDLREVWPLHELEALAQGLSVGPDDSARMAMLATYVAMRLASGPAVDAMVEAAVNHIRAAPTDVRIALLARTLGVSVDTLERRFTASVGVSPKRFARAARLRSAVLSYAADMSLTDLAVGAGYYDQPHFVREMQQATGQPPSRLLPGRGYC